MLSLTVVLEKTLQSPLDSKEIQPVNPKGNQSWIFIGRTDAEAEAPILWPPDVKNWLTRKYPDSGKDWGQEEKGMTEDETVEWHHRLDGHEFELAPGVGDGQGSLLWCSPWGLKESATTEWLNWTEPHSSDGVTLLFVNIAYFFLWSIIYITHVAGFSSLLDTSSATNSNECYSWIYCLSFTISLN